MKYIVSIVLAISLLIAGVAQPASAQESAQLPARPASIPGACLYSDGEWGFPGDGIYDGVFMLAIDRCQQSLGGRWFTAAQYEELRSGTGGFVLPDPRVHGSFGATNAGLEADWYAAPEECTWLPSTRSDGNNLLLDVKRLDGTEILGQAVYDAGSNEPTGIVGAFTAIGLAHARAQRYLQEWRYELQEECQTIRSRKQIDDIQISLAGLENVGSLADGVATAVAESTDNGVKIDSLSGRVDDVKTRTEINLDTTVGSRATQSSLDEIRTVVDEIHPTVVETNSAVVEIRTVVDHVELLGSTALAEVEGVTERVDGMANNVDRQLLELTGETTAARDEIADLRTETDGVRNDVADLSEETEGLRSDLADVRDEMGADAQQQVDLFIEENLHPCTVRATFLIDEGPGLQSETFTLVAGLMEVFGDDAPKAATSNYERALERRDSNPRQAYRNLCSTYRHLTKG